MPPRHPIQRRYLAEDLLRLRRPDEERRYAASQRRGHIDPNPHQVDAVIFALKRLAGGAGGCILADEVGLGKTIEAGLVIAQRLAEGARRVLLVLPKPLVGQWRDELDKLFGISAREVSPSAPEDLVGEGVFLVGREAAGGDRGSAALRECEPFDLCVIDEAHEIFAGLWRRYDRHGIYRDEALVAKTAHQVRKAIGGTPVLLLTATPLQNGLAELWGLAQFVEPTGTLLGDLPTFRQLFCEGDDRQVVVEQAAELRRRIGTIVKRTLRRDAQAFLATPFTARRCKLFEYRMSPEERALYDGVSEWLLQPQLVAFAGSARRLLLLGFRRRMASSLAALASSLDKVALRLEARLRGEEIDDDLEREVPTGFEGIEHPPADLGSEPSCEPAADSAATEAELSQVKAFAAAARALPTDSKARCLVDAWRLVEGRENSGEGSGRMVVFTESIVTQEYLRDLLVGEGVPDDAITLFRGTNDGARARAALARWQDEEGSRRPEQPSRDVATRLALIHEFQTRSRIFISTEAGAKGLNLQFCETLVNYDLPWNPQRIEQRIGRCHRYGQTRDVTVVNFIARDNEHDALLFDILARKLELFGEVLDASDAVLHQPDGRRGPAAVESAVAALGDSFEKELQRIYETARTGDDVAREMRAMREEIGRKRDAHDDELARAGSLITSRFDASVQRHFRELAERLPQSLASLDRDLERLLDGYIAAQDVQSSKRSVDGGLLLRVAPSPRLPAAFVGGGEVGLGGTRQADPVHLQHPLVSAAVTEARQATARPFALRLSAPEGGAELAGQRGRLRLVRARLGGFEPVELLLVVALLEGAAGPVPGPLAEELLLGGAPVDRPPFEPAVDVSDDDLDDALDELLWQVQASAAGSEQPLFERTIAQVERFVADRVLVLSRRRSDLERHLETTRATRDAALGPDARARASASAERLAAELEGVVEALDRLVARDDPDYRRHWGHAYARRFKPPQVATLVEAAFEVAR